MVTPQSKIREAATTDLTCAADHSTGAFSAVEELLVLSICCFFNLADRSMSTKGVVLEKLSRIETELRQQGRLLQSILAAVQTSGNDREGEPPEGVLLPMKTMAQLQELERSLEDAGNFQKLVSYSCVCVRTTMWSLNRTVINFHTAEATIFLY